MASRPRQSQFPRRLPAAIPGALIALLALALLAAAPTLRADYTPSGYQPLPGEAFFLLSDKSFGSTDEAQVRLELVSGRGGLAGIEAYGGVDVALYRVADPIGFLKRQKNLRRIRAAAPAIAEGPGNAIAHLWDRWAQASRAAWRAIFSAEARSAVTAQAPGTATPQGLHAPTPFTPTRQFAPLKGFDPVRQFRYPVHAAKAIAPPPEVALAGSSSGFIAPVEGNVNIPLGRLAPGLYLVEAVAGGYRATTVVFVSDTVAITKTAASEMVVWTAQRDKGAPVRNVEVAWTDGVGVLATARTDATGVARLAKPAPERSFVFGADPSGGVFISENFYYDSEIYNAKIYAVTDRPLYRPGDEVFVKFVGREFKSARESVPVPAGDIDLTVFDPAGAPVARQRLALDPARGGDTSFRLPDNAGAGGYELRFDWRGNGYGAAFRVAQYDKPHFEITLVPSKPNFRANDPVRGKLQLHYPDGKPVVDADIQLSVRAQQLTMLDGDFRYGGQFPVKLTAESLRSDARGEAAFELPPATQPSRYVITALATDGAAFRVKTTRELLIERSLAAYSLKAPRRFSAPGETVAFAIAAVTPGPSAPAQWEWIRLEDRGQASGPMPKGDALEIVFGQPGTYTVQLRDGRNNIIGGTSHWVSGGSAKAPAGSIEIVGARERYRAGDTAELLVTFPEPTENALLTLERDRIEKTGLLRGAVWADATRLSPTQWRIRVPVDEAFAPNITFSVAAVRNGDYVFQNHGLQVEQPRIELSFKPARTVYAPGERVEVEVLATLAGKPVQATLAVGVVDEMIYVLQPEIAPDIHDFFFHFRRNNVRTSSSLAFIGYDLAENRSKGAPEARSVQQRREKLLERPRRDEQDTAYWNGSLRTDASGIARFAFTMPDALTRWRVTGRAFDDRGNVGQNTAWVRADKPLYVKWTSPTWMRRGDAPVASLAIFNQTTTQQQAELAIEGIAGRRASKLSLKPGANYVSEALRPLGGDVNLQVVLTQSGKVVDALDTRMRQLPSGWTSSQSLAVDLKDGQAPLALPASARDVRVRFMPSAQSHFARILDDLLDYPYGCVEQTASRMIPNAIALRVIAPQDRLAADRLRQQLNGSRLRLAYMAGEKGRFTWWGPHTVGDPWLTPYAWYADWMASRAIGVDLPREHWEKLLDAYAEEGYKLPPVQRALVLHWMQRIGLPVKEQTQAFLEALGKGAPPARGPAAPLPAATSAILAAPESPLSAALAVALADLLARDAGVALPKELAARRDAAFMALDGSNLPAARALLLLSGRLPATEAPAILAAVRREMPTMERAITLAWIDQALQGKLGGNGNPMPVLAAPWVAQASPSGQQEWRWSGTDPAPKSLRIAGPHRSMAAMVHFSGPQTVQRDSSVRVTRTLHRVRKAGEASFALEPVGATAALGTSDLYLDEIVLDPGKSTVRYGLVEVPLPPGAAVESSTWGINLAEAQASEATPLEAARHQATDFGYAIAVEPVSGRTVLRHLVRFSQKGRYVLPPARLTRMYAPGMDAFESSSRVVEVR
ncbi:MAG: alpha-2-macroglobulin family protein [Rhodocyclaceae bacterium]|nr:alpha-2-macroglobulin family protein [Rhodocyclaceae bacterium]MCA3146243.1 alpha-2-macroglobulin family protein [Rhodocyclaceae bacterium]